MAHFEPPLNINPSHYYREGVYTRRIWIAAAKSIDVVLWGGKGLDVTPRTPWSLPHEYFIRVREGKAPSPSRRLFHVKAISPGRVLLEAKNALGHIWAKVTIDVLRSADAQLTEGILSVLSLKKLSKIDFTVDGFRVQPDMFAKVKQKVLSGKISVTNKGGSTVGEYDMEKDSFRFKWPLVNGISRQALVIHEATHAGFDIVFAGKKIKTTTSEAAAYLAQCTIARAVSNHPTHRLMAGSGSGTTNDKVFKIAWQLAGKVLAGQQPTMDEFKNLKDAVHGHSNYKGSRRNKKYQYDGVK